MTQENADTFPTLMCRDSKYVQTLTTCCERKKVPQHTPFHLLLISTKILVLGRIILTCDNERSTKSIQFAMIQACVGVDVIAPLEGDHMANGRVEMAVREVNVELWISAEKKHKRAHRR